MKSKEEIVHNWLPRYTGTPAEEFQEYILLVNFLSYVEHFAEIMNVPIRGMDKPMQTATSIEKGITMINFGIGSPNAATIMDLLGAVQPKACLFLGKCGGLKKKTSVGDLIIPIAAIRGEGTSDDYFDDKVPALPSFSLQKAVSDAILENGRDYWTGTIYTTNRRVWEHDEEFKEYLTRIRSIGIDMETATIFMVGFANKIPKGALLLVTDLPMTPDGVKTTESDRHVSHNYLNLHVKIGIDSLLRVKESGRSVKHLKF